MEDTALGPRDYLAILRRRIWSFLIPAALLLGAAFAAALLWPPTYRSTATVLIEEPEIPRDLVETLSTDLIEKRLEAINRRVLVTDNLIGIIERYGLYPEARARAPITSVVETMRRAISVQTLSATINDPNSGRRGEATVAFQVAFEYGTPETAQRVANELVSLYLNENLRQRRERARETSRFLTEERSRVDQRMAQLAEELSEFKAAHQGALPEQLTYNQQMIARAEQELGDLNRRLQSLREREIGLAAQLAAVEPYRVYASGAQAYVTPGAQVEAARAALTTLTARYGPSHPDVVRARAELATLTQVTGGGAGTAVLSAQRDQLAAELAQLRQRYSAEHPDVQAVQRQLTALEDTLRATPRGAGRVTSPPDNPVYISLQTQIEGVRAEIGAMQPLLARAEERLRHYQDLVGQTIGIEQDYLRLTRGMADLTAQREDLLRRESTAQLGQAIETELKGERFSLIEPPNLPNSPERPKRMLILLVGAMVATGGGLGTVALRQALDDTVASPRDIEQIIGFGPLGAVPRIVTPLDRARSWSVRIGIALGVALLVGGTAWLVHSRVMPLDTAVFAGWRWLLLKAEPFLPSDLAAGIGGT